MAPKNSGAQASTKPCGWKFSTPDRWPSWKIHFATPNAAAMDARLVTTPTNATSGLPRATSRSKNPSATSSPNTSGVRAESALSRSWFSAAAPPTSEPAGSSGVSGRSWCRWPGRTRRWWERPASWSSLPSVPAGIAAAIPLTWASCFPLHVIVVADRPDPSAELVDASRVPIGRASHQMERRLLRLVRGCGTVTHRFLLVTVGDGQVVSDRWTTHGSTLGSIAAAGSNRLGLRR